MDHQNITLIGMAGVGKSTIGKRLAKSQGMEFIDTDNLIEKKEMRIIPDIIEHDGEDAFKSI
ncbi:MAG: AAA family ATPase, partial [Nanoarchaeota archaeon]|nr:AAA family ATPase [Nanoarchaeota archaeon]